MSIVTVCFPYLSFDSVSVYGMLKESFRNGYQQLRIPLFNLAYNQTQWICGERLAATRLKEFIDEILAAEAM